MVDRRSDEGEAQVYTDALGPVVHLDGYVPLVVVHRQHDVIGAVDGLCEDSVGRDRAGRVDPLGARLLYCRCDLLLLLVPQQAPIAAVRIEAATPMRGAENPHSWKLLCVRRILASTLALVT